MKSAAQQMLFLGTHWVFSGVQEGLQHLVLFTRRKILFTRRKKNALDRTSLLQGASSSISETLIPLLHVLAGGTLVPCPLHILCIVLNGQREPNCARSPLHKEFPKVSIQTQMQEISSTGLGTGPQLGRDHYHESLRPPLQAMKTGTCKQPGIGHSIRTSSQYPR